jgi:hypothetical protein
MLQILFHEHPSKCVAEGVCLVVDLIGCSRQVGLCTWHLDVVLVVSMRSSTDPNYCAHDANFWRRLGHVDSERRMKLYNFVRRRTITLSFRAR